MSEGAYWLAKSWPHYEPSVLVRSPGAGGEPPRDLVAQHRQRDRSVLEHPIVERAHVEPRPELTLCLSAKLSHFQLPDLIRIALARPTNAPVDVDRCLLGSARRVRELVVDRLLSSPPLRV